MGVDRSVKYYSDQIRKQSQATISTLSPRNSLKVLLQVTRRRINRWLLQVSGRRIKVLNMMELESEMRKQKCRTVIEPIQNKPYMRSTFSKRRNGLFKKSKELTKLTGCEIAILVLSEAGRPYSFAAGPGNPTLDQILDLYTSGSFCPAAPNRHNKQLYGTFSRRRNGLFKKSDKFLGLDLTTASGTLDLLR